MNDDSWLDNPAAFRAKMAELIRRSDAAVQQMNAKMDEQKARATRATLEEGTASRGDVRDVPELETWADDLGYRHGYTGHPLRFSVFAQIMRRELGCDYPGLEPRYYESYYVGGHMRGENELVAQAAYALDHGETRPPVAPFLDPKLR